MTSSKVAIIEVFRAVGGLSFGEQRRCVRLGVYRRDARRAKGCSSAYDSLVKMRKSRLKRLCKLCNRAVTGVAR